jgi:hypothetical protein
MPLTVNLDKAKELTHQKRRLKRSMEFRPHDAVIARQIPNAAQDKAEAERQAIRDKYAVLQAEIDAASTVEEVDVIALGLFAPISNG